MVVFRTTSLQNDIFNIFQVYNALAQGGSYGRVCTWPWEDSVPRWTFSPCGCITRSSEADHG